MRSAEIKKLIVHRLKSNMILSVQIVALSFESDYTLKYKINYYRMERIKSWEKEPHLANQF